MSIENEMKVNSILKGRLNDLPKEKSKIVSIFLSSTFTDFYGERNYLIQNVYPKIKDYCQQEFNLGFIVVDLRWGIERFGKKYNLASEFCLNEIETCIEYSANPCFVALIGDRYGTCYMGSKIHKNEFEALKSEMNVDELKFSHEQFKFDTEDIIDYCYKLDMNSSLSNHLFYKLLDIELLTETFQIEIDLKKIILDSQNKPEVFCFEALETANCRKESKLVHEIKSILVDLKIENAFIEKFLSITEKFVSANIDVILNDLEDLCSKNGNLDKDEKIFLIFWKLFSLNFDSKERRNEAKKKIDQYANYDLKKKKLKFVSEDLSFRKSFGTQNDKLLITFTEWLLKIYKQITCNKKIFFQFWCLLQINEENVSKTWLNRVIIDTHFELMNKKKDLWRSIEPKLIEIFRNSAQKCFDKKFINQKIYDKYFSSLTEQEIYNGILCDENIIDPSKTSFAFIRTFIDIDSNVRNDVKLAKRFIDIKDDLSIDEFKRSRLNRLKTFELQNAYKNEVNKSLFKLTPIEWDKEKGVCLEKHENYFKEFGELFLNRLKDLIKENQLKETNEDFDEIVEEILCHSRNANKLIEGFVKREDLLKSVLLNILRKNNDPLIFYGESGSGKSTLIAGVINDLQKLNENHTIIFRFLGTTPLSSNISSTLRTIIIQLNRIYFKNEYCEFESLDNVRLNKILFNRLKIIEEKFENERIFIFLDAIDQLNSDDFSLNWFIRDYPTNTKFIYSTVSKQGDIIETIKSKGVSDECFIKVDEIDFETSIEIFDTFMLKSNRILANKDQRKIVESILKNSSTKLFPLHVKLLFDIAKIWSSFTTVSNSFSSLNDLDKTIEFLFITMEHDYGYLLVSRCLFYLTISDESGISDCEMEEVLTLDDELLKHLFEKQNSPIKRFPITLWNRLKIYLNEYLRFKQVDGTQVYSWYHRRFSDYAYRYYVLNIDNELKNYLILNMLKIYNQNCNNRRKINKTLGLIIKIKSNIISKPAIFENVHTRNKQIIEKILLDYNFISSLFADKCFNISNYCSNFNFIWELHEYLDSSSENKDASKQAGLIPISSLLQSLYSSTSDLLSRYPKSIGTQICSRIRRFDGLSEYFDKFIQDCDQQSIKHCSLLAPCQLYSVCEPRIRFAHNFYSEIIDSQVLDYSNSLIIQFYLYETKVGLFHWNLAGSQKSSKLVKEFDLGIQSSGFKILRVFKYESKKCYGILVATESSIICFNDTEKKLLSKASANENEKIKDILLISDRGFVVFYEDKNFINVFDSHDLSGQPIHSHKFDSLIKSFCYNRNKSWGSSDDYDTIYISLFLENSDLMIYEVDVKLSEDGEGSKNVIFNLIYKNLFQSLKLTGAFKSGVFSDSFSFIFATEAKKFILIEMNENKSFVFRGIQLDIQNTDQQIDILKYHQNFVVLRDNKNTYFYSMSVNRWFSIPSVYHDVDIIEVSNLSCKIYAFNSNFLDVFLLKMFKEKLKTTKLVNKFRFVDEIRHIGSNDEQAFIQLKNGTLLEIGINSIILSQLQNSINILSKEKIDIIIGNYNENEAFTYSFENREIIEWNLQKLEAVGRPFTIDFISISKVSKILNFKDWIILDGCDENGIKKIGFIKRMKLKNGKFFIESKMIKTNYDEIRFSFKDENITITSLIRNKNKILIENSNSDRILELNLDNCCFEGTINCGNIEFCLTSCSNLLVVILNNQIFCLDVESLDVKYKKTLPLVTLINDIELRPVIDSDNIIVLVNKQKLFYLVFSRNDVENPIIIEKTFNNCVYLLIQGNLVALIHHNTENIEEIIISKLMDETINLIFKEEFGKINHVKYLNITPDCQYLSVYSKQEKKLQLYRINNEHDGNKLIAEIPILSNVNCTSINNKFIILGIDDNRIVSFLIVDPKNKAHDIRLTELRNQKEKKNLVTESDLKHCVSSLVQVLDDYGKRYFSWDSIFDDTMSKDDVHIEFAKYLNSSDVFECILQIVKGESRDKIFKWVFNETSKTIRERSIESDFESAKLEYLYLNKKEE